MGFKFRWPAIFDSPVAFGTLRALVSRSLTGCGDPAIDLGAGQEGRKGSSHILTTFPAVAHPPGPHFRTDHCLAAVLDLGDVLVLLDHNALLTAGPHPLRPSSSDRYVQGSALEDPHLNERGRQLRLPLIKKRTPPVPLSGVSPG